MITTQDRTRAGRPAARAAMAAAAFSDFQGRYPAYAGTAVLDDMRARDYSRLDVAGHVYLDYTGGGLYADSQLARHRALLRRGARQPALPESAVAGDGRPAGGDPGADPGVLPGLTPGVRGHLHPERHRRATAGRRVLSLRAGQPVPADLRQPRLGQRDPAVRPGPRRLGQLRAPHRRPARIRGGAGPRPPAPTPARRRLAGRRSGPAARSLFAYPAQSNFSGVQHPLAWIAQAQAAGYDVLLDAAAFAPASQLDLSRWHPDYVSLSFYKIFGYPTGIGALLARKPALARLRRPWYSPRRHHHLLLGPRRSGPRRGLLPRPREPPTSRTAPSTTWASPPVGIGLDHISAAGIQTIHTRVMCLTGWLLETLAALRHSNGTPLLRIYGPAGTDRRGATIAMNFFDPAGALIDSPQVERPGQPGRNLAGAAAATATPACAKSHSATPPSR